MYCYVKSILLIYIYIYRYLVKRLLSSSTRYVRVSAVCTIQWCVGYVPYISFVSIFVVVYFIFFIRFYAVCGYIRPYTAHTHNTHWHGNLRNMRTRVWFGEYHYMHICIGACDLCIWKHKIMRQRAVAPSFFLSLLSCGFVTFELHCIGYEATLPLRIDNCGCLNYEVYLITLCGYHAYWTDEKTIFVFEFNFGMKLE